jgi:hypothetical protein
MSDNVVLCGTQQAPQSGIPLRVRDEQPVGPHRQCEQIGSWDFPYLKYRTTYDFLESLQRFIGQTAEVFTPVLPIFTEGRIQSADRKTGKSTECVEADIHKSRYSSATGDRYECISRTRKHRFPPFLMRRISIVVKERELATTSGTDYRFKPLPRINRLWFIINVAIVVAICVWQRANFSEKVKKLLPSIHIGQTEWVGWDEIEREFRHCKSFDMLRFNVMYAAKPPA